MVGILADIFSSVLSESSECEIKGFKDLNKDLGVVFTAVDKYNPVINWTLPDLLSNDQAYITLASFFASQRKRKYIRHVLGFVIDFDTPGDTSVDDILDRYHKAKLPLPDLIIASKTQGHYQAFSLFPKPLRQVNSLVREKITRVHRLMATRLEADTQAVGAERWVRRPTSENIVYHDVGVRTSWEELKKWYEAYRPIKMSDRASGKITYIGHILSTDGGQRLQKSLAEVGQRNNWCYSLGLCLWDAGVSAEDIKSQLYDWNSRLQVPLYDSEVAKIYKSVISGSHHASSRFVEDLTGLPSKVNGYYHLPKDRERRSRDHLFEVRKDVIQDLLSCGVVAESQKAWATRLDVSYRTLKLILAQLKEEGVLEANTGRGRYAQSSYSLSVAYLELIRSDAFFVAAAGSEGMDIPGGLNGHSAITPLRVVRGYGRGGVRVSCRASTYLSVCGLSVAGLGRSG